MAEIFLTARELDEKKLPSVCIVCGGKGRVKLVSLVQEVNPLASMFTKVTRYRLRDAWVPLCSRHANYFGRFSWFGIIWAMLMFGTIGGLILGGAVFEIRHILFFLGGFCFFVTVGFGGTFGYLIYRLAKTRPTDMTRKGVLMSNISELFADAVDDMRDGNRQDKRPGRSRRRDEDED